LETVTEKGEMALVEVRGRMIYGTEETKAAAEEETKAVAEEETKTAAEEETKAGVEELL
jgi:hypothetical protein